MSSAVIPQQGERLFLRPFDVRYAAEIAAWVDTDEELRWVAPCSKSPLTGVKVAAWKKPNGRAFMLTAADAAAPIGYGELNPMRTQPAHLWLGHVIVRPDQRGRGTGQTLVRALVDHAFRGLSAKRLSLIVFPDNTAAIECYRRVGFTVTGEESHRFDDMGPRYRFLRLEINAPRVTE